jgi:hypothetical protein
MLFEILVAVGGYYAYRHFAKGSKCRPSKGGSDAIGAAGEATAQAKLRKTLYWLCGNDFYLHEGPLVIEHAPGTEFPTAEIDHLAVTPFWRLHFRDEEPVRPNCPFDRRRLPDTHQRGRHAEDRRSPIHQYRSKVRFLRAQLPPMWPVVGAGLFASADAVLDAQLPSDLITLDDLAQWLRTRRDVFAAVSVEHAKAAVLNVCRRIESCNLQTQGHPKQNVTFLGWKLPPKASPILGIFHHRCM